MCVYIYTCTCIYIYIYVYNIYIYIYIPVHCWIIEICWGYAARECMMTIQPCTKLTSCKVYFWLTASS